MKEKKILQISFNNLKQGTVFKLSDTAYNRNLLYSNISISSVVDEGDIFVSINNTSDPRFKNSNSSFIVNITRGQLIGSSLYLKTKDGNNTTLIDIEILNEQ